MSLLFRSSIAFLMLADLVSLSAMAQDEVALKAYYSFDTENAEDLSGNKLHGVVTGVPKLIDGVVGKAWEFDGATKIDMDYPEFKEATAALSIRCFIMPANTEGQHIIFEEGGAWAGICVRIMDSRLQVGLVCCDAAHPPVVVVSTELPDTEDWIEIAAVFDKGKLSLYMNGKNVGEKQTEWPELVAHGQYGSIGEKSRGTTAFDEGEGFFVGGIDEFRVYRRALQPEEFKSTAVLSLNNLATTWGKLKKK